MKLRKSLAFILATTTVMSAMASVNVFAVEQVQNKVVAGVKATNNVAVDTRHGKGTKMIRTRHMVEAVDGKRTLVAYDQAVFPLQYEPVIAYNGKKVAYTGKYKPIIFFSGDQYPLKATLNAVGIPFVEKDDHITYTNRGIRYSFLVNGDSSSRELNTAIDVVTGKQVTDSGNLQIFNYLDDEVFLPHKSIICALGLVHKDDYTLMSCEGITNDPAEHFVVIATGYKSAAERYKLVRAGQDALFKPDYYLEGDLRKDTCKKYVSDTVKDITTGCKTSAEKSRAIYDYCVQNTNYLRPGGLPQELKDEWEKHDLGCAVLHVKEGRCTAQAVCAQELLISAGIPARLAPTNGHMWVEAFVSDSPTGENGRWIIIDTTQRKYDVSEEACDLGFAFENFIKNYAFAQGRAGKTYGDGLDADSFCSGWYADNVLNVND